MRLIRWFGSLWFLLLAVALVGCGAGGGGTSNNPPAPQDGSVNMMLSDASSEDWATVGVKVLSISLIPQDGGAPVVAYTAPTPAPTINLVQLDQLAEVLGNMTIPAGTYTAASLTISGNPGDVLLTVAANPESGFPVAAGTAISQNQIQIQGTKGSAGSLTATVKVNFDSPLVITANQSNALDLEFDLSHPAFIVEHVPLSGSPVWAVNFRGPLRHHHIWNLADFLLRHLYGTVTAVSSDNTSITVNKDYPVCPPTNPETAIASQQSLKILADAANGTIFYDVDAKTSAVIKDFSTVASTLDGKFVRVAARYQSDGSLVAVRMWASTSFNKVWLSPEGHVLHVNASSTPASITVQNELGVPVVVDVDANTQFYFRTPASALADATPIGTGAGFLANLVRGFKVHVSAADPLASPLVAQVVDIEIARFDGTISAPNNVGFTYNRNFFTASDNYSKTLDYISSTTPNGKDANGNSVTGFKWWNFTFPTLADTGANAIPDFVSATSGSVNFGGTVGAMSAWGETYALWNDPSKPNDWSAPWTVLAPTPVPLGAVSSLWVQGSNGGIFGMKVQPAGNAVTVDVNDTSGSATLVYQVDMTGGIITVSAVDITTSAGLNSLINNLVTGTPVKVFGVPQSDGTIKAYVLVYFTGILPAAA